LVCFVSLRHSKLYLLSKPVNDLASTSLPIIHSEPEGAMNSAHSSRRLPMVTISAIAAIAIGLAIRLFFVLHFPANTGDGPLYLSLARNWQHHGVYGLDLDGRLAPVDIRVPGYPAFLAAISFVFRRGDLPILLAQAVVDILTCLLAAVLAGWLAPENSRRRMQLAAFWLAALCPFLANYSAAMLTEVLAAFWTAAALIAFVGGIAGRDAFAWRIGSKQFHFNAWLAGGLAVGIGTLVRPETPLLLIALALVLCLRLRRRDDWPRLARIGFLTAAGLVLPLLPWGIRNAVTLHEFQVLAPRYATLPGEVAPLGYFAWTNTWLVRYRDVDPILWKLDTDPLQLSDFPASAFDSPEERDRVSSLIATYNDNCCDTPPEWDAQFAEIARERTARHPLRTYLTVPLARGFTFWFTPRVELLPYTGFLWPPRESFDMDPADFSVTLFFAALGILYVGLAIACLLLAVRRGILASPQIWGAAFLVVFCFVRTAYFTRVETPEPRYVLECFPALFALTALLWARRPGAA
jgi:4-amino-4-deoxy-L-arabinose transferase-like glycosyltransferase